MVMKRGVSQSVNSRYPSAMRAVVRLSVLLVGLLTAAATAPPRPATRARRVWGGRVQVEAVTSPVTHAEGPHWDHERQVLHFVDISEGAVLTHNISDGALRRLVVPPGDQPVSLAIPRNGSSSELVVTRGREVLLLDLQNGTVVRTLAEADTDKPLNRFNDGKADPAGRLWAGTMGPEYPGTGVVPDQGSLFLMDSAGALTSHVTGVDVSNGLAWNSAQDTMYYVDTGTGRVDKFDYDLQTGNISNRRVAMDFGGSNVSCTPDSMSIDANNTLWVACWGGWQVVRVDPERGEVVGNIQLPAQYVTSTAWGGAELEFLYVTTSRRDLTPEQAGQQPLAGAVFRVSGLGVRGVLATTLNID